MLCGSSLGLSCRRHRWFEMSFPWSELVPPCQHRSGDLSFDHGGKQTESAYRTVLGCEWMTVHEARQAIPPAYTEWIGRQLLRCLEAGDGSRTPRLPEVCRVSEERGS
jgi:DNA (cytosine-5)-methyltransferase 1